MTEAIARNLAMFFGLSRNIRFPRLFLGGVGEGGRGVGGGVGGGDDSWGGGLGWCWWGGGGAVEVVSQYGRSLYRF